MPSSSFTTMPFGVRVVDPTSRERGGEDGSGAVQCVVDVRRRRERGWSVGWDEYGIAKTNHDKCRGSCLLALGGGTVSSIE